MHHHENLYINAIHVSNIQDILRTHTYFQTYTYLQYDRSIPNPWKNPVSIIPSPVVGSLHISFPFLGSVCHTEYIYYKIRIAKPSFF